MSAKGQTINDRLNAAKYTLAGQALARCICKATTEELMRPKKKHLDYLAACTYQPNVSMQQLTNLLIERTNHSNWAVVYKALITVHHLMSYGSEKFTQYLASSNYSFQLNNFLDRIVAKGYAMSTFIRRYSCYINQKALSYRTLALDLCKAKKRAEDSVLRSMPIERLLETLPVIQRQLDALLDIGCTADELNNSIITASFTLLFHDAIRLFASYNDGIINLFEKYFDLNKKMCREAFEAYKKFLACTDRVADFLKVAEAINLNNGDLPDFKRAPSSLLDAFEQHLISLESNKKRDTKVEVDTKLAAFPSFSVNNDFDTPPVSQGLQDAAALDEVSDNFGAQLSFASGLDDLDFSTDQAAAAIPKKSANMEDHFGSVFQDTSTFVQQLSNDGHMNSAHTTVRSSVVKRIKSPFDDDAAFTSATTAITPAPVAAPASGSGSSTMKNDLFDFNPPGFSDGALLTPEALQISIDPSIDPRTQQQLIQIKREQVANRQNNNNNNNNDANSNRRPANSNSGKDKPSKEKMFEDLEKTMRQSLMNTEKT